MAACGSDLAQRLEVLESELYGETAHKPSQDLHYETYVLFNNVLERFGLCYFNPGEPEAENEDRSIVIPLTGSNAEMTTDEENERILAGEFEIPVDLYWARLRAQQARDILESEEVSDECDSATTQ